MNKETAAASKTPAPGLLYISDEPLDPLVREEFERQHGVRDCRSVVRPLRRYTGSRLLRRHFHYAVLALKGYFLLRRDNPEYVLIWQKYIGVYFSLFSMLDVSRLWRPCRARIILFYVIPKERRLYRMILAVLDAGVIGGFVYFSRSAFNASPSRKKLYLPYFQRPAADADNSARPPEPPEQQPYVFAGGTSNRDYAQIRSAAQACPDVMFRIACPPKDTRGMTFPANVKVAHGIYGEKYLAMTRRARVCVVPLKDPRVTAGQIALLNALENGRPVLTNLAPEFLKEWLNADGDSGVLTYGTQDSLKEKITRLMTDPDFYEANARQAEAVYAQLPDYRSWVTQLVGLY